jgi:phosphatidylserine/phosphatidylglycerophosphate/cardiolipin synthase-like enzyme
LIFHYFTPDIQVPMLRKAFSFCLLSSLSLLAAGCGSSSAPSSNGGSGGGSTSAYITLSASALTFPNTTIGYTSAAQVVTVTNTGTGSATVSGYLMTGNSTDFTETATTCGTTLTAGASCAISVTFNPLAAGNFSLTITASDNATNSPQTITLTGTGVTGTVPTATLTPTSVTFPTTIVATTSTAQTLTLSNGGNGPLAIASIALGGTNSADFTETNNCGTSLGTGSNCTISVTFTPVAAFATYTATLNLTDNAGGVSGTVQSATLAGTSTSATPMPLATLSPTALNFGTVSTAGSSAAQVITLANGGNASLTGIVISLGGTNSTSFSKTTTCGTTLTAGNNCTISVTFTPTTTGALSATISVSDNATGSPQTASLSGTGKSPTSTVSYQFYVFGPPSATGGTNGGLLTPTPLYTLINGAQSTVDMTMYELQDTVFSGDLVADCARGVKVRVILSQSEESSNTPAYDQLNTSGANCSAVFSNSAFENTHQKTITVDDTTTAVLSLNLQTQYYSTSRDYAMVYNDPVDIAAIEATFAQDYAAGTPYNGTQGPSDFSYQPGSGTDLIWSPTTATADMLSIINNAKSTIVLENEEMSASNIVSALEAACQKNVQVHIAMVNSSTTSPYSTYSTEFKALEAAGCGVRTYPDTTTGLYVHAKAVVADYGLSTQSVYMGSINYSTASLTENRELGMYITDAPSIATLYTSLTSDYAGATTF